MKPEFAEQLRKEALYAAVILAHDEFETVGNEPGAESWTTYRRQVLLEAVVGKWVRMTGISEFLFPWREGVVIDAWIAFRKKTAKGKAEAREEYLT